MSDFEEWFKLTDESRSPELKEPMRIAYEAGTAKATAGGECNQLMERVKELEAFVVSVRDNYDCDSDAHKYGTPCRCCEAGKAVPQ